MMSRRGMSCGAIAVVGLLSTVGSASAQTSATVVFDAAIPAIRFAAGDVQAALRARGVAVQTAAPDRLASQSAAIQIVITTIDTSLAGQPSVGGLTPQGYAIRRVTAGTSSRWWAIGADAAGAMYGGLELAEAIQIAGSLSGVGDRQVNPRLLRRGIKFNIPLDARTPSYSDDSTSAQANIPEMWSMDFWTEFLDDCARHRYNLLSLWSLSPFPSLVTVPEYPNVALADVKRKSGPLWDATLQGRRMFDSTWPLDTVKAMTIDREDRVLARGDGSTPAIAAWTSRSSRGIRSSTAPRPAATASPTPSTTRRPRITSASRYGRSSTPIPC